MTDWPTGVPTTQFVGLTRKRVLGRSRTQNDVGPANSRRRFTASVINITLPVVFTNAEHELFDAWYKVNGAASFNFVDPLTGETVTFRFTDDPDFTAKTGGDDDDYKTWEGTLPLEILP